MSNLQRKKRGHRSYRKKPKKLDRFLQKENESLTADLKELSTSIHGHI